MSMISSEGSTDASIPFQPLDVKFDLKVTYRGQEAATVAFLKRSIVTQVDLVQGDGGRNLSSQVQVINLGYVGEENTIFELASTYIDNSLIPLFTSYKNEKVVNQEGVKTKKSESLDKIQNLLSTLRLQFTQCMQDLEIQDVELIIDKAILEASDKCKTEGRELSEEDFHDRFKDQEFIEELRKCVKEWI